MGVSTESGKFRFERSTGRKLRILSSSKSSSVAPLSYEASNGRHYFSNHFLNNVAFSLLITIFSSLHPFNLTMSLELK